ncbi:hypothetical protein PAXRUDRAFT_156072, partial [Paxillus rubicundulus Ve08.2h10]
HSQAAGREEVSEVFDGGGMEFTLLRFSLTEYLVDVLLVRGHVLGIDEDVVQIDYDADIKHISKDCIDETLESRRSIGQTEQHY